MEKFEVRAPFDGALLAEYSVSSDQDVANAFAQARSAQRLWAARSVRDRCRIMLRFHDLVLEHRNEALDLVQAETGKSRKDAHDEVLDVALNARFYARSAPKLLRPKRHLGALPLLIGVEQVAHPKGVVGVIAPWNYPLTLAISDAIPALLAGNAIVLKPDQQTTTSAFWVRDLLVRAGVPSEVFAVVTGPGPSVGGAVVELADYVMFTGSTATGRIIAKRCGERLIGCSMELGGKNAMIVRSDVDVHVAAEIATRACFSNAGQLCISIERMYVNEVIAADFVDLFIEYTTGLRLAAGLGWMADVGSLTGAAQLRRVTEQVDDAVAKGARVLCGGKPRPDLGPYFYEPTILTDVPENATLYREETFGPVVAITTVASDDEAIVRANDTEYGLNASVLTSDLAAGRRIARQLHAGTVNVNEGFAAAWGSTRAPMGGMGSSGLGRRHGEEGLLKYTEAQTIATSRYLGFATPFGWSDEVWSDTLAKALGWMKTFGVK